MSPGGIDIPPGAALCVYTRGAQQTTQTLDAFCQRAARIAVQFSGPGDPARRRASPGQPRVPRPWPGRTGDTSCMVDDTARDRAIYHALKAVDEVAAALQTHLIEEHGADPERTAPQSPATNSFKLLRQARERLGLGLRAVQADHIAGSDEISLRRSAPA
jgi:hypothetical protein